MCILLDMLASDQLQAHAILRDIEFIGRFVGSLQRRDTSPLVSSVAYFCMFPFMSLFVHESEAKLRLLVPQVSSLMSNSAKEVVARSRHSLKLFDDTNRGLPGQLAFFRNEIEPAHRRAFLRPIPWPWAKDLGVYSYDGVPISTTHVATFVIGYEPRRLYTKAMSMEVRSIAVEYGQYFAAMGATLDSHALSFASSLDATKLSSNDHRSTRYYRRVFNGPETPDLNALLIVFQAIVNFATNVLSLDTNSVSWQTVFKIRFLTLYHVLTGLAKLSGSQRGDLTTRSVMQMNTILDTADTALLTSPSIRPLRNTLMHYGLDSRIPIATLSLHAPLYGLVAACLPGHDHASLEATITRQLELTAVTMNQWARP
jgi:hypothetical protein